MRIRRFFLTRGLTKGRVCVFSKDLSQSQSGSALNLEKLNQLSKAELVTLILTQHKLIEELRIEIENLKLSRDLDSKTSSLAAFNRFTKKVGKGQT